MFRFQRLAYGYAFVGVGAARFRPRGCQSQYSRPEPGAYQLCRFAGPAPLTLSSDASVRTSHRQQAIAGTRSGPPPHDYDREAGAGASEMAEITPRGVGLKTRSLQTWRGNFYYNGFCNGLLRHVRKGMLCTNIRRSAILRSQALTMRSRER